MAKARLELIYVPTFDPATQYPEDYQAGRETADRLINSPDPGRIQVALRLTEQHIRDWPLRSGKNGLTEMQYARSLGFRDALAKHLEVNNA